MKPRASNELSILVKRLFYVPPIHGASMNESSQEWILKRRYEDLGVTVRMCWDLYIKFYTVFLTFSVVGLGWILTRPGDAQHSPRETGYCRRLFDPDDPDGGNKRRNRALSVHVAHDQEH